MLGNIKEAFRAPVINKLHKKYRRELDNQYVSYDSWITQKEFEYLAGSVKGTEDVQVIEYADVTIEKPVADIILYVNDRHKLSKRALHAVCSMFNEHPEAMVVYGDEDEYNSDKRIRMNPTFRPDWSPETLTSYLYMGNVFAVRRECLVSEYTDVYDLIYGTTLGLTAKEVLHVDYVLYHNNYSKALFLNDNRFAPEADNIPLISIVIPSKDNPDVLSNLLRSMTLLTREVRYEVIVIDNGSSEENRCRVDKIIGNRLGERKEANNCLEDIRYVYAPQEFNFSRICNEGAAKAKGKLLLFLNDDIEIRDGLWLKKMAKYALLDDVGAVGAKLYYPDSKIIQHCGITNLRLGPVHKLQYKPDDHPYYDHMNDVNRNVLAVTGACLMINKQKFDEIGGFDTDLRVAFNDVDLCYSLYEKGYHNVVVNTTHLWHYESLSRGDDESKEKLERLSMERSLLYKKHPNLYAKDPYYHDYLTSDILDSNYTCAYEYEYDDEGPGKSRIYTSVPVKSGINASDEWNNDCLVISLEQCGTLEYWKGPNDKKPGDDSRIYIGGYGFVSGSDNACFDFGLLLNKGEDTYSCPLNRLYRPDLEINVEPEENAVLCGFSVNIDTGRLDKGEYRVGMWAKSKISRMKLVRYTNRYITIK